MTKHCENAAKNGWIEKKNYPIFVYFIQYCRALVNSLLPPVFSFSDVFREFKKGTSSSDGLRDL